jgi:hypothetical protein
VYYAAVVSTVAEVEVEEERIFDSIIYSIGI